MSIKDRCSVNIPILMLTARDSFADKVKGFDFGADEYLTKPYDLRELALRCKVLTRREELYQSNTISLEDLSLDINENKVLRFRKEVVLNKTAFSILLFLVTRILESTGWDFKLLPSSNKFNLTIGFNLNQL